MRYRSGILLIAMAILLAFFVWQTIYYARVDIKLLAIPFGFAACAMLAGVVIQCYVLRWNHRFNRQRCPNCNYDMRATPDRCPECGHEVTSSETPLRTYLGGTALDLHRSTPRKIMK